MSSAVSTVSVSRSSSTSARSSASGHAVIALDIPSIRTHVGRRRATGG
jgi:hypothetical protein